MTYGELVAAIIAFCPDAAIEQTIPTFIRLAEADMNRLVRAPEMVRRASATLNGGADYLPTPEDFAAIRTIDAADQPVERRDVDVLTTLRATATVPGRPMFFSVAGRELQFAPAADADYELDLTYFERLPALTEAAPNNWLCDTFPDAYLYGALTHAGQFLGDGMRGAAWAAAFQNAIAAINSDAKGQGV